jgi:hypothetical protein
MAHIRVIHDRVGETLTVYWGEPSADQVCEEAGNGVLLIKNARTEEVVGFERLYYRPDVAGNTLMVEASQLTS